RAAALAAADHADDAGPAEAGDHLVAAEGLELFGDGSRRAMDVEQELWVSVDIAPPGGNLAMQVGNAVHDRHLLSPRMTQSRLKDIMSWQAACTGRTCGIVPATSSAWLRATTLRMRVHMYIIALLSLWPVADY